MACGTARCGSSRAIAGKPVLDQRVKHGLHRRAFRTGFGLQHPFLFSSYGNLYLF